MAWRHMLAGDVAPQPRSLLPFSLSLFKMTPDRLGIIAIVLLATDERLHLLWADDLHPMSKIFELARPTEHPSTSLHRSEPER